MFTQILTFTAAGALIVGILTSDLPDRVAEEVASTLRTTSNAILQGVSGPMSVDLSSY